MILAPGLRYVLALLSNLTAHKQQYRRRTTNLGSEDHPQIFSLLFHPPARSLSTLASNPASQLQIFRHDGDSLGVDGTEVGILEEPH
jgi:hypothetical protein